MLLIHGAAEIILLQLQFLRCNLVFYYNFFNIICKLRQSTDSETHHQVLVFMSFIYLHYMSAADEQQALSECFNCYCSDIATASVHIIFCCQVFIVTFVS